MRVAESSNQFRLGSKKIVASALQLRRTGNLATFCQKVAKLPIGQSITPEQKSGCVGALSRDDTSKKWPSCPVASGGRLLAKGCHGWPP